MFKNGRIYPNTLVQITITFTDDAGDLADPSTVVFRTESPNGRRASYTFGTDAEIQKDSTGIYIADVTPDESGRWSYRWETTGPVFTTEDSFIVLTSPFVTDCYRDYV